jgi:hypothetical protein
MRIIVTGGRDFANRNMLNTLLDNMNSHGPITEVVEGGARGADRMAREWAHTRGIPCITVPANWDRHGRSAGMIRNIQMLVDFPEHVVVAFPGGRGTTGMIAETRKRKRNIIVFTDTLRVF